MATSPRLAACAETRKTRVSRLECGLGPVATSPCDTCNHCSWQMHPVPLVIRSSIAAGPHRVLAPSRSSAYPQRSHRPGPTARTSPWGGSTPAPSSILLFGLLWRLLRRRCFCLSRGRELACPLAKVLNFHFTTCVKLRHCFVRLNEVYSQKRRPAERHGCDQQDRSGSKETREEAREVRTVLHTSSTAFVTHLFALFPMVASSSRSKQPESRAEAQCE